MTLRDKLSMLPAILLAMRIGERAVHRLVLAHDVPCAAERAARALFRGSLDDASNIIYAHRAAPLSDAQIIAATRRELADFAPDAARARLLHASVHRIPMATPCPCPGTERLRPLTLTPVQGPGRHGNMRA